MQPEARISKKVKNYIISQGGYVVKIHGEGDSFQEVGIADLLGVYRGLPLALEVKQPGKRPSAKQKLFLQRWAKAGGIAAVVTSVEDVEELLAGITGNGGR